MPTATLAAVMAALPLALSSKATYYTVLTAAILAGVGYFVARLVADRKGRA